MRTITRCVALEDWTLDLVFEEGLRRIYDVKPLLECEAFRGLKDLGVFLLVRNHGYFVAWPGGADLSADTLCLEGSAA